MDVGWPASRTYVAGSVAAWGLFLLAIYVLAWGSEAGRLPAGVLWTIAVAVAASVAVQFVAAYRLIARQDEYIRGITAKRIIAAAGLSITMAVFWGIADQFLGAPRLPVWILYPFFWGALGIVTPFIRDSRP